MKTKDRTEHFYGLSAKEAAARLIQFGYNNLPSSSQRSWWVIFLGIIKEPIFLLLMACGLIYLFIGDTNEAIVLSLFVGLIVWISLYQEQKAERSLEAMRDLSSPRALVIRDGTQQRIDGRSVVPGDLLVLAEGDRVPADAILRWSTHLEIDESLLTGESVSVRKRQLAKTKNVTELSNSLRPGGDDQPIVYSGTLVIQGQGVAEVISTGLNTEMGKIGKALQSIETEDTLLQKETRRIVAKLTVVVIGICITVVLVFGITRDDWLQGLLAGFALAMAILPNEIPVVLSLFLSLGAWRFSRKKILTRRLPVVETLGSATVLCVDKTGTLTFNQMGIKQLLAHQPSNEPFLYDVLENVGKPLPEAVHRLIEFGILASRKDPFDPMEKALQQIGWDYLGDTEHLHEDWTLLHEYPLSGELLAMSCVWDAPDNTLSVAAKGAPEAIMELCHLSEVQQVSISKSIAEMAVKGLRVLGVARGRQAGNLPKTHVQTSPPLDEDKRLPGQQHDFEFEFVGLLGLEDPVRPTVSPAVKECYDAGVRVVMITGDYPATAQHIARQIGLRDADQVLSGAELALLNDDELLLRMASVNIFARVVPEQKLRIVNVLKASGEIVAMTGDGVNDAPALKAADIGIAMGGRGTDVAREAADLVLLEDDFSSIVAAIKLGRRIFDNLKKAMAYTLAVHVPIAGLSLIAVLLGWPLILLPIHIAFLHLIIDPACTIVFEAEPAENNTMQRPPRDPKTSLFSGLIVKLALFQGLSVLLVLSVIFGMFYYQGDGENEARTLVFIGLIISNLAMIVINRSWVRSAPEMLSVPNSALWWVLGCAVLFLGLILYVPFLREQFSFSVIKSSDLLIAVLAGALCTLWFEIWKLHSRNTS